MPCLRTNYDPRPGTRAIAPGRGLFAEKSTNRSPSLLRVRPCDGDIASGRDASPEKPLEGGSTMKSTILWALVVLNVLLLGAILARFTRDNAAMAQNNPPGNTAARRPGDYLMIPGEVPGAHTALV